MDAMHLSIFGRRVRVEPGLGVAGRVLREELAAYPPWDALPGTPAAGGAAPEADYALTFGAPEMSPVVLANPSSHPEGTDGFTARYTMASVEHRWRGGRLHALGVRVHRPASGLWRAAQRAADVQFASREARAGMIAHELALVPAAVLDEGRLPVHASGLQAPDGGVLLLGGTGGVGKTSLCLELGRGAGYRFLADDIAVMDAGGGAASGPGARGHVYPNLAYPKVYAYNVTGHGGLRAAVLGGRGALDRLHWAAHKARGLDKVRRRVPPDALYGPPSAGGPLARYVVLTRENRDDLELAPLGADEAAALSVRVLQTEFAAFLTHLHFHAYNRRLITMPPIATPEAVAARWREGLAAVFAGVDCQVARIPMGMDHGRFRREMRAALVG